MRVIVVEGEGGVMVYCKKCGVIAGTPGPCPGWQTHSFATTMVPVICKHCGAMPGRATRCPGWQRHNFLPMPDPD